MKALKNFLIILLISLFMGQICYAEDERGVVVLNEIGNLKSSIKVAPASLNVSHYEYEGERYPPINNLTKEDFNAILDIFSDDALTFDNPFPYDIYLTSDIFSMESEEGYKHLPKKGVLEFFDIAGTNNDCWQFYFDEKGVLVVHDYWDLRPHEQGYFSYKNASDYTKLINILDKYGEEKKEERRLNAEDLEKRTTYIYNAEILYEAEFSDGIYSNIIKWGFISYTLTPEEKNPIISAYVKYGNERVYTYALQEKDIKNNTIYVKGRYFLLSKLDRILENKNLFATTYAIKLDITDDYKINKVSFTRDAEYNENNLKLIDMSTYKEKGSLPKLEEFQVSVKTNSNIPENKDSDKTNENINKDTIKPNGNTNSEEKPKPIESANSEEKPKPSAQPNPTDENDDKTTETAQPKPDEAQKPTETSNNPQTTDDKTKPQEKPNIEKDTTPTSPENNIDNQEEVSVYINGDLLEFDQPPIIENDRVLVPMRKIFEALGAKIDWQEETKTVTAKRGDDTVIITIGNSYFTANGNIVELDTPAKMLNGRTLIPLRAVSTALNKNVDWVEMSRSVVISD